MLMNKINGMNVIYDKKYELLLAIHAVFLKNNTHYGEELNWIETPNIPYFHELEKIINSVPHDELIELLIKRDCGSAFAIALSLNDNFDIDEKKMAKEYIEEWVGLDNFQKICNLLKEYAIKIGWDAFFENHKNFYIELVDKLCDLPKNLDMNDIENFYGNKVTSFNYIPSILMNGGLGGSDGLGNIFFAKGFRIDVDFQFNYDRDFFCEVLFHEFSHPYVNPIVYKYYDRFTNVDKIYADSLEHNLPKDYHTKVTVLIENFVRENACILNKKYFPHWDIEDYVVNRGFNHLRELTKYVSENYQKYSTYEEFFVAELIDYFDNILEQEQHYLLK